MIDETKERIRVLEIPTGGLFSDGVCNCLLAYLEHIDKNVFSISAIATNSPGGNIIKSFEDAGCKVVVLPGRKKKLLSYFIGLTRHIKKNKYDIVHIHGSSALMTIELLAALLSGCKARIVHSHNTKCENQKADKVLRPLFRTLYTHAVACGTDAGRWMFGNEKFEILPNGRDLNKYKYSSECRQIYREKYGIKENELLLGHVGCFNLQKNQKFIIDILACLKRDGVNAKLLLIGDGELIEDVKELAFQKKLDDSVVFTGVIDTVADVLSAMDIMVLPSLYEGLPLAVIEWQAEGLPCVISDAVTDECRILDSVMKVPLKAGPEEWANVIRNIKLTNRAETADMVKCRIRNAGYDIVEDAKKLESVYRGCI